MTTDDLKWCNFCGEGATSFCRGKPIVGQECPLDLSRPVPVLLQDETQTADSKRLSQWFAGKPNARQEVRNVVNNLNLGKQS